MKRAGVIVALAMLVFAGTSTSSSSGTLKALPRLDVPRELKVISYYRPDAGWTKMWTDWRPDIVAADLTRVASFHANTVRVVVQADLFGYPHPSPTYVSRLQEFTSLAAQAGLHVQLTLFDWWYDWADVRGSRTWARELLRPYVNDSRIAFIELRNEIELKPATMAWARRMIPFVRRLMHGRTPVTLSVTGVDPVARLAALKRRLRAVRPDFFDIHYFYGRGGELASNLFGRAKAIAAPEPLWVGETGYPTTSSLSGYGGVPRTPQGQEAAQAHFLASAAWAARANGLPALGIWTLYDFLPSAVPDGAGATPDAELHFGLLRTDGSEKPAARIVRATFSGRRPVACNNGFEDAVPAEDGAFVPAQWSMTGSEVAFAQDGALARSGAASARLAPRAGQATGSLSITPPNGAVRAGESVSVRVWARGASAMLVLEWFDRRGRSLGRSASHPVGGAEWSALDVNARAPARSTYVRIELVADRATEPVWFDDVSFRKAPPQ